MRNCGFIESVGVVWWKWWSVSKIGVCVEIIRV